MILRTKQPDGTWKVVANNVPFYTELSPEQMDLLKGEKGDPGEDGQDGLEGAKGDTGDTGKSAYEVAVEQGFPGNKDAWLESLKGKDGQDAIAAITPRGNWVSTETYMQSDYISASNGNSYTSLINDNINNDPTLDENKDKWQLIALKGAPGEIGETPDITMTATTGSATGSPSIVVTKSGSLQEPSYNFEFNGIGTGDDPNTVKYPDIQKVNMNDYIDQVQQIIDDPDVVKYPDVQEVDLDGFLENMEERLQEQIENPDFIKYQDINVFDIDGYVQGITERQDQLDEDYGSLTELDFDILTASSEIDADKNKPLDVVIERDDQNFNFKFQGLVSYDQLEEVDLTEWAGEIVQRQDELEAKYDGLVEIDVEKIEGDIDYIKDLIDTGEIGAKIDDANISDNTTWSSQKMNEEFPTKSDVVLYPDIQKINMNDYIEQIEEIIADPQLVKYPDIQKINMNDYIDVFEEMITDPDIVKYQDINVFDIDGYVQGITERQDQLDEDYGSLTELDFDILTASTEIDTDKTKTLDIQIERDDQNFNFKFQGLVSYDQLEEVDLTEWAGEIVQRQDELEAKYDGLVEIDVDSILDRLAYLEEALDIGTAREFTAEKVLGTLNNRKFYEKIILCTFSHSASSGSDIIGNVANLNIDDLISCSYTSKQASSPIYNTGNSYHSGVDFRDDTLTINSSTENTNLDYNYNTGDLVFYWKSPRSTPETMYVTLRYTKKGE